MSRSEEEEEKSQTLVTISSSSTLTSDLEWTLDEDGMYLAPGVMRFRRGWTVFRELRRRSNPRCVHVEI
jgi:hypothetical protein